MRIFTINLAMLIVQVVFISLATTHSSRLRDIAHETNGNFRSSHVDIDELVSGVETLQITVVIQLVLLLLKPLLMDSYLANPINVVLRRVMRAAHNVWPLVMFLMLVIVILGALMELQLGGEVKEARSLRHSTITIIKETMDFVSFATYKQFFLPMTLLTVLLAPMLVAVIMGGSGGEGEDEDEDEVIPAPKRRRKDTQRTQYLRQMISSLLQNVPEESSPM